MACGEGPAIRGANPVWLFADLVGNLFDDSFYMWVLENEVPYIPATVWHDAAQTLPWTSPIQFLANGTLPIDIYWDPSKYYRLEFRQNDGTLPPSQNDPLIYLVENYNPGNNSGTPIDLSGMFTENQISNPQFSLVNFPGTLTLTNITNPAPIEIAPDWFLELTGTGSVTVEQVPINNAVTMPTNAPYALRINLTGSWTGTPVLRQRFQQNGILWANKYVSTSLTARMDGPAQTITARIDASNGAPVANLLTTPPLTTIFVEYKGFTLFPASGNPDIPPDAYLDYKILLPTTIDLFITSLQVISSDTATTFEYEQNTVDRQIDHTFHYYKPQLEYKPIPSYLIGWDFPLNPVQFGPSTVPASAIGANKSKYVWDQTIIFQSANNGVGVTRAANGGITLTSAPLAGTQMALIQYLDISQTQALLNGRLAVGLSGLTNNGAGYRGVVSLWATDDVNLPDVDTGTNNSIVLTLNADGSVNTRNGAWTEIPRGSLGNAYFNLETTAQQINLNGWDFAGNALANTATFFAIVVSFPLISQNDSITFDWISLCHGDIATRPAPKTAQETTIDCNRFYFKTFNPGVTPAQNVGVATGDYRWTATQVDGGDNYSPSIIFPAPMRTTPEIIFYNPAAANAQARNLTPPPDDANATDTVDCNLTRVSFNIHAQGVVGWAVGDRLAVHFTADARLGIVN